MPITRSTGRIQQGESVEVYRDPSPTFTAVTTGTETANITVMPQKSPPPTELVQPQIEPPTATPCPCVAGSRRNSRKSTKQKEAAKVREELLKLKIELATARLAVLEADSSDDESFENEDTSQRVDTWLNNSMPQALVTTNILQEEQKPEPAISRQMPVIRDHQQSSTVEGIQNQQRVDQVIPLIKTSEQQATSAGEAIKCAPRSEIAELTSAITLAVRAGQHNAHSRFTTELPFFSGSHQEWLTFRAAFTETSHSLSEVENIARLRRCLKGRARESVENLLINQAKTADIMKTLENRFGRPDVIASTELERLRTLPRLTDSPKDLCIFASRVSNIVAALRALDRMYYLYNPEVTRITIEKLTPTLRYRWFDYAASRPKEEADLLKLSLFLDQQAEICSPYAQPEAISTYDTERRRPPQRTYTATEEKVYKYPICQKPGHSTVECQRFKQADSNTRWDLAKTNRLCFRCLRYRSRLHSCKTKKCTADGCKYWHHRLLHFERTTEQKANEDEKKEVVSTTWIPMRSTSYLKILPVRVCGSAGEAEIYALLDDGSTVTLIDSDITKQIGATGPIDPLKIEAIAETEVSATSSRRVKLTLKGINKQHSIQARTMKNLQLSAQEITEEDLTDCKHLTDIREQLRYEAVRPKMLIGQDNWFLLHASKVKRGYRNQPVASKTPLGWVLHGAHTRSIGKQVDYVHNMKTTEENMDEQLRQFFDLDNLIINPKKPTTDPEQRALDILENNTIQTEDGHYQVRLLWKQEDIQMPNNYANALMRLHNTEKKIDRDAQLKRKYSQQIQAMINKGYAEIAPTEKTSNRTWYLPHFGVVNPMKPEKLRVVHDAAAKTKGVSLNDHLLTGPDLLRSLPGVLMRFRRHSIAVTSDIAEMFMQVKLDPSDRDAVRFLWRGDERGDNTPSEYRMTSLIFGATCSPSTAIFVKNLNALKHEQQNPEAVKAIIRNHYVDDYLDSFKSTDEAIKIATAVRDIHQQGGFQLRQWASNSPEVLATVQSSAEAPKTIELSDGANTERVLGLIWKPATDELAFNLNLARVSPSTLERAIPTKREALRIVMSLFDPLGLASPVTIRAKQILQEIWRRGTDWDDPIDEDLAEQWQSWMTHLQNLRDVVIPRAYLSYSTAKSIQLHVFVDASESAYAAALYWRIETANEEVYTSLIIAKAKVAPLKLTSIPRLELQAAVMGCRMAVSILEEHEIKPECKFFWTDSRTVLSWLKTGSRSYRPFVAHRIAAIEEHSTVSDWRWVPTKLNVADDATRDVPSNFSTNHRWFRGPEFLLEDPSSWPSAQITTIQSTGEERVLHIRRKENVNSSIPDSSRFSKWEKLLRTTARVLQFIQLCRPDKQKTNYKRTLRNKEKDPDWKRRTKSLKIKKIVNIKNEKTEYIPIGIEHLRQAEILLVRASQAESFRDDIENLRNNRNVSNQSKLRLLSVTYIDGIIRLQTRIGAAIDIPQQQKSPPVLDGSQQITRLWIEYTHRQLLHAGVECTLNECRQHYWILRLRPTVRTVVSQCLQCRIRRNMPTSPPTGNHPPSRLAHHHRPFTYTGVDYFGPLTVTVGRSAQKRYVALFTCLTTRAIHLEIVTSLNTDSAVMALRRMMARRGCPTEIWSDNGTNFHGADKELRRSIDKATGKEAEKKMINWRYIPPGAPFMGGAWERMVRAVKNALYATLNGRQPTEEVLTTLLLEVEYIVNSRPLTHVSVNSEDEEALTPNHFLLGGSARVPNLGTFDENDVIGRKHWRASQQLADTFWSRWLREYLPDLQYRREPQGHGQPLKTGDVVLIVDNTLPRNTWPRGIVVTTYPGADGVVRAADVRTKGGVMRRATKKLVILPTERVVPSAGTSCVASEDNARRENVRDEPK